jgi:Ca2+-binding EF-hand superfamily protein
MIVLLGAIAVLLLTGSDSLAQDRADRALMAAFQQRFDLLDANKDGKVTRKEYVDFHCKRAEARFASFDKDKNGYVTREEAKELVQAAGDKMEKVRKQWQEKRQQQLELQQQQQQQQQ